MLLLQLGSRLPMAVATHEISARLQVCSLNGRGDWGDARAVLLNGRRPKYSIPSVVSTVFVAGAHATQYTESLQREVPGGGDNAKMYHVH